MRICQLMYWKSTFESAASLEWYCDILSLEFQWSIEEFLSLHNVKCLFKFPALPLGWRSLPNFLPDSFSSILHIFISSVCSVYWIYLFVCVLETYTAHTERLPLPVKYFYIDNRYRAKIYCIQNLTLKEFMKED